MRRRETLKNVPEVFRCRLCNIVVETSALEWTLTPDNEVTELGSRLMVLLQAKINDLKKYPHSCCKSCSVKVYNCFDLITEMQASNIIIKQIYDNGTEDFKEDIFSASNVFTEHYSCCMCGIKVKDMKNFLLHYQTHVLNGKSGQKKLPVTHTKQSKRNTSRKLHRPFETELKNSLTTKEETKDEITALKVENNNECDWTYDNTSNDTSSDQQEMISKGEQTGTCYNCEHCQTSFKVKGKLKQHLFENHIDICNGENKLSKKFKKDGKLLICKYCASALRPKTFKVHLQKCRLAYMSNGSLLCHLCGKFVNHLMMKGHMYVHRELDKGEQTCNVCNKVFRTSRSLRSHMILHDDSRKIICEICGAKTHPYSLWKHVKKHKSKEKKCKYCDKAFTFNYMLKAHLKMHERGGNSLRKMKYRYPSGSVHKCPKCDKEFSYVSMLNAHMKDEHNEETVKVESIFGCKLCDKTFDDQYSLKNHLLLIHEASKEDISDFKNSMQLGVFHCTLCKSVLQSEHGLRFHLRTVHELQNKEMPDLMRRQCEKCNRSFTNKAGLTAHIKSVHLNIGNLSCEYCLKTFKRHQGLINHKLIHLGKKPFECELCSRTFRQRSDVIRHLQRHVRDGEATLEQAVARNNSESSKLRKSRIFLKDSSSCSSDKEINKKSLPK